MLSVGIVANEASGDQLGAALISEIKRRLPTARFVGVAGPRMAAAGCESLVPMERLSVMGLLEVVRHLPGLWRIRRRLLRHFLAHPPDVFIGVDAPDFNLGLEARLRRAGVPTAHLVSPTVWAWRPKRVKRIRRALDLMLSIFPFEADFLQAQGVPVVYVGHPLADQIPLAVDQAEARQALGLPVAGTILALLPGSRRGEVERLAGPFLAAARWCLERRPGLRFVTPLVNANLRALFEARLRREVPGLPISLVDGQSLRVIAAADLVLTASGTATLETLLLKRPMVVGYRLDPLSYWLVKALDLIRVPHIAMANLLAGERLAPELVQEACRGELLGQALLGLLDDPERVELIRRRYAEIHRTLRQDAAAKAAEAVLRLVGRANGP